LKLEFNSDSESEYHITFNCILKESGTYSKYESVFLALTYTAEVHPGFLSLKQKEIFVKSVSNNKMETSFL